MNKETENIQKVSAQKLGFLEATRNPQTKRTKTNLIEIPIGNRKRLNGGTVCTIVERGDQGCSQANHSFFCANSNRPKKQGPLELHCDHK
jgi:hypothetical protein